MIQNLRRSLYPERYHGRLTGQKPPFFEGWYYKFVAPTEQYRFAVIPGIIWGERSHSFVQVLDGEKGRVNYHEYPTSAFWAAEDRFEVHVGENRFKQDEISLAIDRPEQQVTGRLRFQGQFPWPVTLTAPGIMGWYAWVPFMECYHGVLSLDHAVEGAITFDGQTIDFTDGRGYMEKDWGRSFPQAWIWFQSNHFGVPGTSLTASIAIIPWVRTSFPGFIIGLLHEGKLYRFATYTGAKTDHLAVTEHTIAWAVGDKEHRLEMFVTQGPGSKFGLLKGPDTHEMGKRVAETISATVAVKLTALKSGRVIFEGTGRHAGLEVHEVESRLLKMVESAR